MKVLLTGSSGFLGKIILAHLTDDEVFTIGRSCPHNSVDLTKSIPDLPYCQLVIHAAGKAHLVPKTNIQKSEFFKVNVLGTENLLKGLDKLPKMPQAFVFISSVAVYGKSIGDMIDERTPLEATDAYGLSKIEAEKLIFKWCIEKNVKCTILRLPLLAGPNPPGNLDSMIKGIKRRYYFGIKGNIARKSIVLAEDVAKIIKTASLVGGTYNLTDGVNPSIDQLANLIARQHCKNPPKSIPLFIIKICALMGDLIGNETVINSKKLNKILSNLTFDDSKARNILSWTPKDVLNNFNSISNNRN